MWQNRTKAANLAGFAVDRAAALSNRSLMNYVRADYTAAVAGQHGGVEAR